MAERSLTLRRIIDLQRQRRRQAEWSMLKTRSERDALEEKQAALRAFTGQEQALGPLLQSSILRTGWRIASDKQRLAAEEAYWSERLRQAIRGEKLGERLLDATRLAEERAAEDAYLEDATAVGVFDFDVSES